MLIDRRCTSVMLAVWESRVTYGQINIKETIS